MIVIDFDKCIGCFKCVSVCPFRVLTAEEEKPVVNKDALCIKCLHCAAACPQNAISYGNVEGILDEEMPVFPEN